MKISLEDLKNHGADGFVFGILKQPETCTDGEWIDVERNKKLVQLADGRPCTFHRAFDCIPESCWDVTLTGLMACGFSSILTSGGSLGKSATDHIRALKSLSYHKMVATSHQTIDIIIGGGVRSTNIQLLWRNTNAKTFHSSALVEHGNIVSTDEVSKLRDLLQSCNLENMESGNY